MFLCAGPEVEGETQWSLRLGRTCRTELDLVPAGLRTSVNGGVAGGWFGWGARQDGPLLQAGGQDHPGTVQCRPVASSTISDYQIEKFNKEFITEHPVYR